MSKHRRSDLELLRQLVPKATTIAVLVNPNTIQTEAERKAVQAAAQAIGRQLIILDVSSERDIETAFAMQGALRRCSIPSISTTS